jgi:hypothetical protein
MTVQKSLKNLSRCKRCHSKPRIEKCRGFWYAACSCGLSGPMDETLDVAVDGWNIYLGELNELP